MAQRKKTSIKPKASPPQKIRPSYILIVEDEPTQAAVIRRTIRTANPNVKVKVASSLQEYRSTILNSKPEIVLMDIHLPDGKAFEVLTSPLEAGSFPIVVMTGYGNEKIAVKAMKKGALDYVVKSPEAFKTIPRTLERALREWKLIQERKKAEEALHESELRFYALYENVTIGLYRTTLAGKILMANRALVKMLGYSSFENLAERNLAKFGFEKLSQRTAFLRKIETEGEVNNFESVWIRQDGSLLIVRESARAIRDSFGKTVYYDGVAEDITERRLAEVAGRHAEDALRESEEKFRSIAENFHDVLFITDTKGIITYISPAVDHVFGYKSEDMKGRFFGEYLDEVELPRIKPVFERAIRTGIPTKNLMIRAKRRDGKIFYAELDTSIVKKNGEVQGTTGVIRDISERKRAEDTIRESEDIFRNFMEHSPIYVFFKDENIRAIRLSKNYETMLEKPIAELLGKNMDDLFPSEIAKSMVADDKRIMREGKEITIEEELNGRYYSTVKFPIFIEGKPRYLAGFTIDITERKQAEESIVRALQEWQATFDSTNDAMWILDKDQRILRSNKTSERIFQRTNDELIGKHSWEIVHGTTKPVPECPVLRARRSLHRESMELQIGKSWFEVLVDPILDATGRYDGAVHIVSDITERKRTAEALSASEEKYRLLFENNPVPMWVFDVNSLAFLAVNDFAIDHYGYSREEFLSMTIKDIRPPEDIPYLQEVLKKHTEQLRKVGTTRHRRKDGSLIEVEITGHEIEFEGHRAMFVLALDITERKRTEEALRNSEEKFRKAFITSPDSININRLNDGVYVSINQGLTRLMGYTEEDILGKTSIEMNIWVDLSDRNKLLEGLKTHGVVENLVARFRSKTGEIKYGMMSASIIVLDGIQHILSITRDITERKQAEEALRESEVMLKKAQHYGHIGSWSWNIKTNRLEWSDEMYHLFGIEKENFSGTLTEVIGKAIHPDDRTKVEQSNLSVINDKKPIPLEYRIIWPDQSIHTVWAEAGELILDTEGNPVFLNGVVQDITERKQAEEARFEALSRFSGFAEASQYGMGMADMNGTIMFANSTLIHLLGEKSMDDCLGKIFHTTYYSPSMTQRIQEEVIPVLMQEGHWQGELELLATDGRHIPTYQNFFVIRDEQGRPGYIADILTDITERKRTEEMILKESNFNQLIIANAGEGICVCHNIEEFPHVQFTLWNEYMTAITGYSMEEINRLGWYQSMYPDPAIQERAIARMERMWIGDNLQGEEWEITRADGQKRRLRITSRILNEDKEIPNVLGVMSDITEHKQADEALRQMQKLEGLGTLAGGIAHDFNNILGIILAYNANIKRHKDDAKQLDLATDTIAKAVERGTTLVSQILTFARRSGTEFGPVNVPEVVMEIVTMIIETFPKILTYSQNFDKDIPIINADRSQLHQALLNLCVNARDVMPNGGVLTINTRMVSGTSLRNLHPDPLECSYVCIEVIDTGEGMTDEIRKRIFEPFFTTKEKGKGTGLGLAVVFGIVQTHKGFIDVESELGKGTTFRMYIPVSQAATPISLEVGETIEELPGGKETLLVVEDELNLRMPLLKILREKGYTVLSAENGLEGAKIYEERNNDIALVITDLGLPKMSGMDLCKRIKQLNPSARIVVATGYLAPENKLEFQNAGIQNILYKPYNAKKVLKVREVLDEK